MFDVIKTIAPTLAASLIPGGAFFGTALTLLGKALGMDQPTVESVSNALKQPLTADQQLALQKQENDFKLAVMTAATTQLKIESDNIDDARERELEMAKIDPKGNWPLYSLIYTSIVILLMINVGWFFMPLQFNELAKYLDTSLISGVIAYMLGINQSNK